MLIKNKILTKINSLKMRTKMKSELFQNWRKDNPFIEDYFFYPEGEDCHWGRVKANWNEKREQGKDLSHLCAFTIDLQTGDIYLDCSKRKIWAKCLLLSAARPLYGLVKTVYHLVAPLSIPIEIFKAIVEGRERQQSSSEIAAAAWRNVKNSLTDIIRTPFYTIAMMIVTLAGIIIGFFAPHKLYDIRALAGRLERDLNRGQENLWTIARCFQPLNNLMDIHKKNYKTLDTEYEDDPTLQGLNNLARSYVNFMRKNRNPFDHCGALQPKNVPFTSAAAYSI